MLFHTPHTFLVFPLSRIYRYTFSSCPTLTYSDSKRTAAEAQFLNTTLSAMINGTIHISPPRYGTQTELSPDLSSHKIYCAKARDYISPGSFVLISESLSVFQILLVLPSTSNKVPEIVQERAALDTRSQVLKLLTYKRASQLAHTHSITPLHQRAVHETVEVVKTNEITYTLNTSIDSICFGFHVDSLISGENYCNGIGNTFMIDNNIYLILILRNLNQLPLNHFPLFLPWTQQIIFQNTIHPIILTRFGQVYVR